jgi:ABC-2 type transport system ATP-binding protein
MKPGRLRPGFVLRRISRVIGNPMRESALHLAGLTKSFAYGFLHRRRRVVLRSIDLNVPRGGIFGYLGPNGSGKTTTLKIVMGLLRADAGTVFVLGCPLADPAWRARTGYLPEHPYLYDYLTAAEYLDYVGRLFSLPADVRRERALRLLRLVGLERAQHQALRRFSKGMVQRVGIAQALMNDPELVVLDEPMSGLDPLGRRLVRDLILDLKAAGKTVIFSTHILGDAEALCDEVAVLRGGELLKSGRLGDILKIDMAYMELLVSDIDAAALDGDVRARQPVGERWRLEVATAALGNVISAVERAGGRVLSVLPIRQSLEEYFLQAMGSEGQHWAAHD